MDSKIKQIQNIFISILVGVSSLYGFIFILLPYIESIAISNLYKNFLISVGYSFLLMILFYINVNGIMKMKELSLILKTKDTKLNNLYKIIDANIISTVTDLEGNIIETTSAFLKTYNYKSEEIIGKSNNIVKSNKVPIEIYVDLLETISKGEIWNGELLNITKNGQEIWINSTIFPEYDIENNIMRFRSISHNINEQKRANYLLENDALTGLPNKSAFEKSLKHAINLAERLKNKLVVIFIDIDNFKDINEQYSYHGGDRVLLEITKRLKGTLRQGDILSRYSGDEFVILVENTTDYDTLLLTESILDSIKQPIKMNKDDVTLSVSMGLALYPENGTSVFSLIKNADSAMIHVKNNGKNHYRFFDENIAKQYQKRIAIENAINKSLKNEGFVIFYQPKYDIKSKRIIGAEALIKMKDNTFTPTEFIAVAEECDKVKDITKYVIKHIINDIKYINNLIDESFNISINLSFNDVKDDEVLNYLISEFKLNDLNTSKIGIELTEYALMKNVSQTIYILKEFQNNNIEVSIDDFGTGYSSMSYLKLLPVDVIKIDKSFIDNIVTDIKDKHIVTAMINLSKSLNLDIIVEGIETIDQEDLLFKLGCNKGQGYLFAKPLTIEDFKNKLINN